MVKLETIQDKEIAHFISKVTKWDITKFWLKDILLQKEFHVHHHLRDSDIAKFFQEFIWDNLSKEQQNEAVQALNSLIEEDLLAEKAYEENYCFHLLELAILLQKHSPGKINTKPFLIWKEKDYPNLSQPIDHNHYVIKNLDQKIKNAFEKS